MQATPLEARPRYGKGIFQGLNIGAVLGIVLVIVYTLGTFIFSLFPDTQARQGYVFLLYAALVILLLLGFSYAGYRGSLLVGKVWVGTIAGIVAGISASIIVIISLFFNTLSNNVPGRQGAYIGDAIMFIVVSVITPVVFIVLGTVCGTVGGMIGERRDALHK